MRALEWLFVAALVLYSLVIWAHRVKRKLYPWMVRVFGLALTADIIGTIFLCAMNSKGWALTFHTVSGFASLLIMALHFSWALLALAVRRKFEIYFNRFSIYAWCLWLAAFISGVPLH